jgi:hypothetical protein
MPPCPTIILDFPYDIAQAIVKDVLIPHARPEHVFAGYYRHEDGKMTLGCYIVVPVPDPSCEPMMFVIGNERDCEEEEWRSFRERLGEFGRFAVSCGIHTGDPRGSYLTKPEWFLEVQTFHRTNVRVMTTQLVFGL